jgi:hypothetical protein
VVTQKEVRDLVRRARNGKTCVHVIVRSVGVDVGRCVSCVPDTRRHGRVMDFFIIFPLFPPFCDLLSSNKIYLKKQKTQSVQENTRYSLQIRRSSPGRSHPGWPKDFDTSVPEMKVPLTSTFTDDTRVSVVTTKTCLFCGWKYFYRPIRFRQNLGVGVWRRGLC